MDFLNISKKLVNFIQKSPSMFHTCSTISKKLDHNGFKCLEEGHVWNLKPGGKYYTTRNGSSLIAFTIGEDLEDYHFQITASHSDSPTFKIKTVPTLEGPDQYIRLNVEGYGGMIDSTWFDRPLGIAGRVLVKDHDKISSRLLHIEKDVLIIPNVAIHLNRTINSGYDYNRQVDLCPLFSSGKLKVSDFNQMIADSLNVDPDAIVSQDLFIVNHQAPSIWGWADEFVSSPKLDDLQCAFASLEALIRSNNRKTINVYACFDNEEVGSNTKQGAMSTFLHDCLRRVNFGLGYSEEAYYQAISKSFLVSCDNGHAVHPNHGELTDDLNCSYMNKGIVIKEAANQKYTTDAFSQAVFKMICENASVPIQHFANRSNMQGGSTLGNLSNTQVSVHAIDIGLAQLAMHSSFETAGVKDTLYAIQALLEFYDSLITIHSSNDFMITRG